MDVLTVVRAGYARDIPLPTYGSLGAAGMDLAAAEDAVLLPGEWAAVGTGLFLEIPRGFEGQVRPRSGLALKYGVTVLNAPGTIDADYRGEVRVILINHGRDPFTVSQGDRIAQLVLAPVTSFAVTEADRQKIIEMIKPLTDKLYADHSWAKPLTDKIKAVQ